jgi:uncharacterized phage protein (TIGR02218 family)
MKPLSVALKNHYALGTTTLTTCWKATLTNGAVVASTSLDQDIVFAGVTYLSTSSYRASNVESSLELNPDNMELEGFLASPQIAEADIYSGLWDYAAIEIFEINYRDLSMGRNVLRMGTLGQVKAGRSTFNAEMRGLMQAHTRSIVRLTTKVCTAELGDARCTKALSPLTVTGAVDSVSVNRVIFSASRTEAANWFTAGKLTFTSGLNNGLSMEVKQSALGEITLHEAMPYAIAAGDTYSIYAGCTKRFLEDCKGKHNNAINFRGFPHLPGNDAYKYGGQ